MNGIVRKIDHLGRIVIPKEIREVLGVKAGDKLTMELIDGKMYLRKNDGKGYARALDHVCRWVIPVEIRNTLNFKDGQQLDISYDFIEDSICIQKYGCEWCNNTENLIEVNRHTICLTCADAVVLKACTERHQTAKGA